jgi:hypothetical protein
MNSFSSLFFQIIFSDHIHLILHFHAGQNKKVNHHLPLLLNTDELAVVMVAAALTNSQL